MNASERNKRLVELQSDLDRAIESRVHEVEAAYDMEFAEIEIEGALKAVILKRQVRRVATDE